MKIAIISLGGWTSTQILEECKKYFDEADDLDLRKIDVRVNTKGFDVLYDGQELKDYDCIYVRGSYKYALVQRSLTRALFDKCYMPLAPKSFTLAHNKFLTLLELHRNKVPLPTTYLAATVKGAKKILKEVNYPIIMKIPEGTQGKGVMYADSVTSARTILDTLDIFKQAFNIQEYIESESTDTRVIVVGDKVVASMKRKGTGEDVRANIHAGGIGIACTIGEDVRELAIRAAKAINADICAVDILDSENRPAVIEVNISPGLRGITKATKQEVCKKVAKYLYEKTKRLKEDKQKKDYGEVMSNLSPKDEKEVVTNLNIKEGVIKIPKLFNNIAKFKSEDNILIIAKKGKLILKKEEGFK